MKISNLKFYYSSKPTCLALVCCVFIFRLNGVNCANIITTPATEILVSTQITNIDILKLKCETHENCSSKLFTLDSYCCTSSGVCCNWFEFTSNFQSKTNLPYKSPTILTIFTLLIMIVCMLFLTYCFSILFCYCFKCGLFKKPNLIVIAELASSQNGSDSISAEIVSPKHSSSSSSYSSSCDSPYAGHANRSKSKHSNLSKIRTKKSGYGANYRSSSSTNNNHSNSGSRRVRSPTARATSTAGGSGGSSRLFAKPECYVDYDNESPFLIPQQLAQAKSHGGKSSSSKRRAGNNNHYRSSNRSTSEQQALAPQRLSSSRVSSQHNPSSSSSAAVALIDIDSIHRPDLLDPTPGSSRASSSLDFGTPLMEAVESAAADNGIALGQQVVMPNAPSYYLDEKPPSYDDIIGKK